MTQHTLGWDIIPSNENHGPYVTTQFGSTVCDCYCMSDPASLSIRNGGTSKPINHMYDHADDNDRLIAAAPELLEALEALVKQNGTIVSSEENALRALAAIAEARGE